MRLIDQGFHRRIAAVVTRQAHPIDPAHQAAGLDETGRTKGVLTDEQTRAEADAAGKLVGFVRQRGADLELGLADTDVVTHVNIEASQQRLIDHRTKHVAMRSQQIAQWFGWAGEDRSVERIGVVDGFDFDQCSARAADLRLRPRRMTVRPDAARHSPQRRDYANVAAAGQKRALLRGRFALDQRERDVAAQNDATLARQTVGEPARERPDTSDGHHADRETRNEHVEAAQPALQLANARCAAPAAVGAWIRAAARRRSWLLQGLVDAARAHAHDAIAAARQRCIMGHQHKRGAVLDMAGKEEVDDMASRILVEIAGRLVSHKNCWTWRKRARQRHPLLLAAGQFGRIVGAALGKSDGGELALGALERISNTRELERHGDILDRRHRRDQME